MPATAASFETAGEISIWWVPRVSNRAANFFPLQSNPGRRHGLHYPHADDTNAFWLVGAEGFEPPTLSV